MAESFSRQKSRHAPQKEGGLKILCDLPPVWPRLVRPLMSRMDGKKTHKTHVLTLASTETIHNKRKQSVRGSNSEICQRILPRFWILFWFSSSRVPPWEHYSLTFVPFLRLRASGIGIDLIGDDWLATYCVALVSSCKDRTLKGRINKWANVCCVLCVCYHPNCSGREGCGRISRGRTGGRSHRISHPPSFCGACLNFFREKDSAVPFPRRAWSRIWCTNELIILHLLGIYFSFFCEEKSQFVWLHRDSNSRPNVSRFRGYQLNHRGDRNQIINYSIKSINQAIAVKP